MQILKSLKYMNINSSENPKKVSRLHLSKQMKKVSNHKNSKQNLNKTHPKRNKELLLADSMVSIANESQVCNVRPKIEDLELRIGLIPKQSEEVDGFLTLIASLFVQREAFEVVSDFRVQTLREYSFTLLISIYDFYIFLIDGF